jgi:copper chaperone NosL
MGRMFQEPAIMNNNKLSIASRILVAFASGALISVFFLPAWRIDLFAPQYPEGLTMNIWVNGLSGDVDVINGLNHYIGMKHITVAMFPEFKFLPFVVAFFMLLGMIVSITGKRKFLFIYLVLTAIGGILAMYDFYQWGYKYGHDLDPKAPIQVPGLSYQPPLVGHKRLLNFDAYSFPDVAGWIVIGAAALAFGVWFFEWYHHKRAFFKKRPLALIALLPFLCILFSCNARPTAFKVGKDNCSFCKMGITDTRFGGEAITKKGKVYLFDDMHCLASYLKSENTSQYSQIVTVLFNKPNTFTDVNKAWFAVGEEIKSPMGSNAAAFDTRGDAQQFSKERNAEVMDWVTLKERLK